MRDNVLIIQAGKSGTQYFRDLWHYRELFVFLAWRDILVRYKQTVFGVLWAILRPFLAMVIFTIIFGRLAKMDSGGVPYPIFVFAAMLPWQFFSSAFSEASNSLISNSNLLSKVYFPRIILPSASVIVAFIDFLISTLVLVVLIIYFKFIPSWRIITIPLFILFAFIAALGPAFYITSLNVKYRDFCYVVPFIVQFGLYISPVGFSSSLVPEKWRLLYSLNPMVGVIDGFRWAILGQALVLPAFLISLGMSVGLMVFGIWYFRKMEKVFADVV
jgi:homopolymeric O-antigen transport system permease protein